MAGRWNRWMAAGLLVGAIGCKQNQPFQPITPGMPQQTGGVQQYFGGQSAFQPQAPTGQPAPELAVAKPPRKPGQKGFDNPDTDVAWASTSIAAAIERENNVERDALLDTARQKLQSALQKDPKNKSAHVELAKLYSYTNEKDKAVQVLMQARQHHPKDHELPFQQARICVTHADWNGGLDAINGALALDPENRTYHKVAGVCLAQMQRYDMAQSALMKVMSESQALYFIGRVMIDQNQYDRGRQQIEQAAALDPRNGLATQFLDDFSRGNIRPMDTVQLVDYQQPANIPPAVHPITQAGGR